MGVVDHTRNILSFMCVQTFAKHNRTQGIMEKSQQELKRTRMENRKFKDLASFGIQCHLHSDALAVEYDDGLRKTCFRRKVRNARMLYVSQITENNLCMVNYTLFRFQKYQDCDTATEKWSKREKKSRSRQEGWHLFAKT